MQVVSHLFLASREGGRREAKKEKRAETRLDLHLGGAGKQAARSRRTVALWFGGSLEKEEGNLEICAGVCDLNDVS